MDRIHGVTLATNTKLPVILCRVFLHPHDFCVFTYPAREGMPSQSAHLRCAVATEEQRSKDSKQKPRRTSKSLSNAVRNRDLTFSRDTDDTNMLAANALLRKPIKRRGAEIGGIKQPKSNYTPETLTPARLFVAR